MIVNITPSMAQGWIDSYTGAQDHGIMRSIRPWWVNYLVGQMRQGTFSPTSLIMLAKVGDEVFIVNGNHTLRAIVGSGVTIGLPVERFECGTVDEVRHMYATADHPLKRQRSDSFRAYDTFGSLGINLSDARSLASAVTFMMNDYGRVRNSKVPISDSELLVMMQPWVPMFSELLEIAPRGHGTAWHRRLVRRASVCAVAMMTVHYQPVMARDFWVSVVNGTGIKSKTSPALKLRDYLMETMPPGGNGAGRLVMENHDLMAKKVAHCWNQFYLGKSLTLLRVTNDKPLHVLGRDETRDVGRAPVVGLPLLTAA